MSGHNPETIWHALWLSRQPNQTLFSLGQISLKPFSLCLVPGINELLHRIDHAIGGGGPTPISGDGLLASPEHANRLQIRSLMEEAIESSRIEGAVTTRRDAIELLKSGKPPTTKSEFMVVNNYQAMQWVKQNLARPLSIEMLFELQRILTRGTLKDEETGRLRRSDEHVRIVDERSGEDIFVPPHALLLPARLAMLCDFANQSHDGQHFLHPILKACILHFMIGYEHPFVDGNGRTARAVFYWFVLRNRYQAFEYMAISELIIKAYAQYPQAFVDVEDDNGDLTYFVAYKLGIIWRSIERLREHLEEEQRKVRESLEAAERFPDLNLRQRMILGRALRRPQSHFTVLSHMNSMQIAKNTARADLEGLQALKLLGTYRRAKEVHYVPAPDLARKLAIGPEPDPSPARGTKKKSKAKKTTKKSRRS